MNTQDIKLLLDKYFEGETTLEEEAALHAYFTSSAVDESLKSFVPLFTFFKTEQAQQLSEAKTTEMLQKAQQPKPYSLKILRGGFAWKAAAAVLILAIGSVIAFKSYETAPKQTAAKRHARVIVLDGEGDPEQAFAEAQKALMLISKKMKKGTDETAESLQKVKSATEKVDKVLE